MFTNPLKLQIAVYTIVAYFAFTLYANAQSVCPQGLICLTQSEANVAAQNARELVATKEKVGVMESAFLEKDKSIAEVRANALKNEADLKTAIHQTEVKLATATGQLIEAKADKIMYIALIEYLTKNQRAKKIGLINLF